MKNSGRCPKCESKDCVRLEADNPQKEHANYIPQGQTVYSGIPVTRYVCCACGYSEEWIDKPEDLKKLKVKARFY